MDECVIVHMVVMFRCVLLIVCVVVTSAAGPDGTDDCKLYVGVFPNPDNKCSQSYYECDVNGNITSFNCSNGEVLDPDSRACASVEQVKVCEELLALPADVSCVGVADGSYGHPGINCSVFYYICNNENVVSLECVQQGTRFDDISDGCLFPDYVQGCGGVATTLAPQNLPATRPASKAVDCTQLPDGDYANPDEDCSHMFISCSGGAPITKMCGSSSYYDVDSNRCLFPENVPACGGTATTAASVPPIQVAPFQFNCSGIDSGLFGNPVDQCSNDFVQCSNGFVYFHQCAPGNLRFDAELSYCQNPYYVPICGGMRTTSTQGTTVDGSSSTKPPSVMNCMNLPDGRYPDPMDACSPRFFTCIGGSPIEQNCPEPTRFDSNSTECMFEAYVASCGGSPTTTEQPFTGSSASSQGPDFVFDCITEFDGFYEDPRGCSNQFVQCSNGATFIQQCNPKSLRFDLNSTQCLEPEFVEACGGVDTSSANPSQGTSQPQSTASPLDLDCSGRVDGLYEDPLTVCSPRFFSCGGELGTEQRCPDSSFFDMVSQSCQLASYNPSCGGDSTTTQSSIITSTVTPYFFDCSSRNDGDYEHPSNPCTAEYVTCSAGKPSFRVCNPSSLKFDEVSGSCQQEEYTLWCGGINTTTVASTKPPSSFPPPNFSCVNLTDGFYNNPDDNCSAIFFSCVGNISESQVCPDGTKYDKDSSSCLEAQHILGCGGQPTTQGPSVQPTTMPSLDFNCSTRADGNFPDPENPCSARFVTCSNNRVFVKFCSSLSLRFDVTSDMCLTANNIRACGGTETTKESTTSIPTTTSLYKFDCQGKSHGQHADPRTVCSDSYFTCTGGKFAIPQNCAPTTYYWEYVGCVFYNDHPGCTGTTKPPPTTTLPTTTVPTQPTTPPEFDCVGKREGNHPNPKNPCSPIYYTCAQVTNRIYKWNCPGNTYYDVELNQCLFFNQVPECSMTPRPPTTTTVYHTTQAPLFDCSNEKDGNYKLPGLVCPDHFYQCANYRSFYTPCPGSLKYTEKYDACIGARECASLG